MLDISLAFGINMLLLTMRTVLFPLMMNFFVFVIVSFFWTVMLPTQPALGVFLSRGALLPCFQSWYFCPVNLLALLITRR